MLTIPQVVNALSLHVVRDRHWYFVACSATNDSTKARGKVFQFLTFRLLVLRRRRQGSSAMTPVPPLVSTGTHRSPY
jgi:hypothetical protein